jgi:hypothetical protein
MTGIVLALAGLTAGDGGPGAGAATAPLQVAFRGVLIGTLEWVGGGSADCVLYNGVLRYPALGSCQLRTCALLLKSGGRGRVVLDGEAREAIYKLERDQVVICAAWEAGGPRPRGFGTERGTFVLTIRLGEAYRR